MPRKNIYIRERDVDLFRRAEALAGKNFSALLAKAVEQYLALIDPSIEGLATIEILTQERGQAVKKSEADGS